MNRLLIIVLCLTMTVTIAGCGGGSGAPSSGLTPLPNRINDLPNTALAAPLAAFIQSQNAPAQSSWDIARPDLDGDGRRDAIVLFKLPHSYWCGWDGCGMLVLRANETRFTPITAINNVRGPIYISSQRNNGWRDIIIRVTGTNFPDKNIVMKFNGNTYPNSPLLGPDLEVPLSALNTERFFR